MGIFDNLLAPFTTSAQDKAANDQANAYRTGLTAFNTNADAAKGDITQYYGQAANPWQQNFATASQGTRAYADAMGLNGPEGNARAVAAFQNNPGYQFGLTQLMNAVQARNQAAGSGNSGNAMLDLLKQGKGYFDTNWNTYTGNLQPYLNYSTQGAQGLSNVYTGEGTQLAGVDVNKGNAALGVNASIGNAQANADLAPLTAGGNTWGALLGAANLGVGGGATLGGQFLSGAAKNLFNTFQPKTP